MIPDSRADETVPPGEGELVWGKSADIVSGSVEIARSITGEQI